MRRLVQHALAGVGFSALTVGVAVAGLGSPAAQESVVAVPVTVAPAAPAPSVDPAAREADRVARQAEQTRSATRDRLATAVTQAATRSAALTEQSQATQRQRAKIVAARKAKAAAEERRVTRARAAAKAEAKAERERAAEAKARAKARAEAEAEQADEQGYETGTTDPKAMARQILQNKFGYGDDQFSCFNDIIIRESNWDVHATNTASGAYGIPQALPGTKMASVADDWRTNPATQIIWGVQYMKSRYGSPCAAWAFKSANGWY